MDKMKSIPLKYEATAFIDANRCTNCGRCRDYCPVEAISEKQKAICHLCPDCTEIKAITPDDVVEMQGTACTLACPVGLSPQGFLNLLRSGKEKEAFETIWDKNPLPAICGYVCFHPCEQDCKRGLLVDNPMEIRAVQRYLSETFIDCQPAPYPVTRQECIAVVGSGPAGLTAAHWLAKKGYRVTVFEQNGEAGGMMLRGIPSFRIDKEVLRKEIERLQKAGIEFVFNTKIGDENELLKDYDKVVVAVGAQIGKLPPIKGARSERIYSAVNLMERVNAGQAVTLEGVTVVIGGGSVAVDAARSALRLGSCKVCVICLESGADIPAHAWEIKEAEDEGIEFIGGVTPLEYLGYHAKLSGVRCAKISNLDTKTLSFDTLPGSEFDLPADNVIVAVGQKPDRCWEAGPGILLAGDVADGRCSVVDAMASGRQAAIQIDNALRGRDYAEFEVERTVAPGDLDYKIYPAVRRKLDFPRVAELCADTRRHSFDLVELGMGEDDAKLETLRCMQCGYNAVDAERCIGCGVCQKVCPMGDVISMIAVPGGKEA
uniref:NADPH-dependent glutamate synthase beta chain n=1 Tax=uncultured bacterium contig00006 TaxID=1181498 RepID=A0A806JYG4_9BACT|nr:NADPH-dependent glutamate synthase beta chain [uncultured bacterium contig00006]